MDQYTVLEKKSLENGKNINDTAEKLTKICQSFKIRTFDDRS